MSTQPSLFDSVVAPPHRKRSPQSRENASRIANGVTKREAQVLQALVERFGSSTPDEIAEHLHLDRTCVRPRCTTMAKKGWLTTAGKERRTGLGGKALVYVITQQGRKHLAEYRADVSHAANGRAATLPKPNETDGANS